MFVNRREVLQLLAAGTTAPLFGERSDAAEKPLRVLILGGTGFIGPHTIDALRFQNQRVQIHGQDDCRRTFMEEDPVRGTELRALPGAIEMYRAALALTRGDVSATVTHARRVLEVTPSDDDITFDVTLPLRNRRFPPNILLRRRIPVQRRVRHRGRRQPGRAPPQLRQARLPARSSSPVSLR